MEMAKHIFSNETKGRNDREGARMKKWMTAFTIDLYLVQVFTVLTFVFMPKPITMGYKMPVLAYVLMALLLLSVFLAASNIACAAKIQSKNHFLADQRAALKTALAFKLGLIPFFTIHLLMWLYLAYSSMNPLMIFLWGLIPIGVAYAYMVLMATSSYSVSMLVSFWRMGVLSPKQCVVHTVLQFIFVADVISHMRVCRVCKG
jgi:hypothetical protein